jgi:hypothetical protein
VLDSLARPFDKAGMGRGARPGAVAGGTRGRALVGLLWTGEGAPVGRLLAAGAVVWLAYAVLWLVLEGPVLDESAAAAPIVAGDTGYPDGHPNAVLYRRPIHFLYQLGALQWQLYPDPWWISATRNLVFLFLSAFVPYAVVVACTRRPAWGHVAVALTLSEAVCSVVGVYLMWVFPGVYSSGHFGIHLALLTVVLLGVGIDRSAGVLTGLMPTLHGAMAVVVWPAVALLLGIRLVRGERIRRVLAGGLVGVGMSAAVAAVVWARTADDVAAPPYEVGRDPDVLRTFIRTTDPHRQPLPLRSPIGLVGPIAFAMVAAPALAGRRDRARRATREGVVLLGALAWSYALGSRALHGLVGELPLPLLMLMPARYANLGMLVVVPLAVVALATCSAPRTAAVLAGGLLAAEATLLVVAPHVAFIELLYAVLGVVAGAMLGSPTSPVSRVLAAGATAGLLLATAVVRAADGSPIVWAFVAGLVPAFVAAFFLPPARRVAPVLGAAVAAASLIIAAVAVRDPHFASVWDFGSGRETAEEAALATWLDANVPPRAMLLVPPFPPTWLEAKTGHPVLLDTMTLVTMSYVPELVGPIARLVRDVFEIDYADPAAIAALSGPDGMLRPSSPAWLRAWPERPCATWRELGTRYGFDLVLAPRGTPLRLESPWSGPTWTLYRIPATCPGGTPP